MVQKVDLDEKEHALSIVRRLERLKLDLRHCDFIVVVGGDEYHAHRNILSAGSDYFDAMLSHDTKENQLGKVEMMDVDSECVKVCIDYIYTGKADIPDGKAGDLMHVAHLMQLNELCDGIAGVLEKNLNIENLFKTKVTAELYNLEGVLAKCCKLAGKSIAEVSAHSWFLDEPKQFLVDVVTSKNVSIAEEQKVIVFLRWIKHKPERAQHLAEFMDLVKLQYTSVSYRRYLVESEPLIMNSPSLVKIFCLSIMDSMQIKQRNKENFYDNKMAVILDEVSGRLMYYDVQTHKTEAILGQNFDKFLPCTVAALHSHIFVLSKNKSVHRLRIADENTKWEKMQNMIEYHGWYPPAVSHDGSLYTIGGSHERCTAASEKYLPDANKWVKLTDKLIATEKATLVSLDEHIYSAGGFADGVHMKTFSRFSPASSTWIDLPPMTRAKRSCGATAFDHNIYILGGFDDNAYFQDVDCFNVITSQWTSLPPMSVPRGGFSVLQFSGVIYIFGGEGATASQLVEEYDPAKGTRKEVKIGGKPTIHFVVRI